MKKIIAAVAVALFVGAVFASAAGAAPGNSGNGGNNGGNGVGSGGQGQGGGVGNGNVGGGPGQGGGNGGNGGGNNGGGGSTGGGTASTPSTPSGQGDAGAYLVTGGEGFSSGDLAKLVTAIKKCEATRPGLAIGDYRASTGAWSFATFDDTVWPFVQRCMKAEGYPANGIDYSETTNFGQRR